MNVRETKKVINYLTSRKLITVYKKAKLYIENDNFQQVNLKKRNPKSENVWYFRISKKYRVYAKKTREHVSSLPYFGSSRIENHYPFHIHFHSSLKVAFLP